MADEENPSPFGAPPPQWPPPPTGYFAPTVGGPPVNATLILVFGVLSMVTGLFCGIGGLFGIAAWIMGNSALTTLGQTGDPWQQRGTVNAGRICGMVGTAFLVLSLLIFVGFFLYGAVTEMQRTSGGILLP